MSKRKVKFKIFKISNLITDTEKIILFITITTIELLILFY